MSTNIQWTDETWNPIAAFDKATGKRGWYCAHVSPGCQHCYAETMNTWRGNGQLYRVPNAAKVDIRVVDSVLRQPLSWRTPRKIFVCSMTDLFVDEHTDEMIDRVFAVMAAAPRHVFQVLTKRPARMLKYIESRAGFIGCLRDSWNESQCDVIRAVIESCDERAFRQRYGIDPAGPTGIPWPLRNVWLGTSVEDQRRADERVPILRRTPAAVRFLSAEPLLERIYIQWTVRCPRCEDFGQLCSCVSALGGPHGVHWVIVGGESGPGARPFDLGWAHSLVTQCRDAGVPAFVKQLGAVPMEAEAEWRDRQALTGSTRLLNARNRNRVPDGYVPLKLNDSHGGEMSEWPEEELRVREFPKARTEVPI